MATVSTIRLFPPIVDNYLPAMNIKDIDTNNGIKIPFYVNDLDSTDDIKEIHISITRQSNYNSLLNNKRYPLGVCIISVSQDTFSGSAPYYVTVPSSFIQDTQLNFNEYYKIQLRFSIDNHGASAGTGANLSDYLMNEDNLPYFSEWSRVCVARFIAKPTLSLQGNVGQISFSEGTTHNLYNHFLDVAGRVEKTGTTSLTTITSTQTGNPLTFTNSTDSEVPMSWRVKLLDGTTVLVDSGENFIERQNDNTFQYNLPYYFVEDVTYTLQIDIITANLYTATYSYTIEYSGVEYSWSQQNQIKEYLAVDSVIGKVNITFEPTEEEGIPEGSSIAIRRASDIDNFGYWGLIWEYNNIPRTEYTEEAHTPISFNDFTIESGVLYKYAISYTSTVDSQTKTYTIIESESPIISIFDHAFLTGQGTQLCVKFNPSISNYKVNVSDVTTNTIGGTYPYIVRNGNMYYRSFSLNGMIAYEMDAEHQFASRSSIYGDWISVYGSYFVNRYINQQNDKITQRKFRELVLQYLYDDTPKLFRSTPEGNILVRLTDITLTPNTQLGRMIYEFSCVATEIGECTIENLKLYNIQEFEHTN